MKKVKNSYKKGILTFIVYPSLEGTWIAACEELCIVREDKDLEFTKLKILADAKSYISNVCKNKLGEHLLNQSLPDEIKKEFYEYRRKKENELFQKWNESFEEIMKIKDLKTLIA
jgi:hypothetical protein